MKNLLISLAGLLVLPGLAWAGAAGATGEMIPLTGTAFGMLAVALFVLAYILVPLENTIHLRKSKPVLLAAGIIWVLVALAYAQIGDHHTAHDAIKHSLLEYAELFLFLLAAMTYINAMEERNVFQALRAFLVTRGFSLRAIFWITGLLAFFISPVADNLTTALLMGAVVMAVGGKNRKFVAIACINIVIAANAGGAFSPFGDITTLMVWQKGKVAFGQFFAIFVPSAINWLVPAVIMNLAVSKEKPNALNETVKMKYGAKVMIALFLLTIMTAVCFHNFLHLPASAGMMLGLGYLGLFSYHIKRVEGRSFRYDPILGVRPDERYNPLRMLRKEGPRIGSLIEGIHFAAFTIDMNHVITHWNRGMEKITGVPASERVGTTLTWSPFYQKKRPALADLVLDHHISDSLMDRFYKDRHRQNDVAHEAFDAADFFPTLGEDGEGKWLGFTAAPIKTREGKVVGAIEIIQDFTEQKNRTVHFDIMRSIARAEWDTLLFFYGVILCVGGLSQFGYLALVSQFMYTDLGPTVANTLVGVLSAIVDNIPVMFAVLTMDPQMSLGQWLLVTFTAGTGGSLLAIGSAAGVALMGTARGVYTFGAHLKWTPVIALGYLISIWVHLFLNAHLM